MVGRSLRISNSTDFELITNKLSVLMLMLILSTVRFIIPYRFPGEKVEKARVGIMAQAANILLSVKKARRSTSIYSYIYVNQVDHNHTICMYNSTYIIHNNRAEKSF